LEAVKALAEKFHQLPQEIRSTVEHASYVEGLRDAQMSKVWEDSIAAELDGLSVEALREMLASIEASQEATRSRILDLQPQSDESVAENSVAGEEAASPASGEVQGKLKQLPEDLTEKPEPASGNAAPWRARKPRVSRAASVQVRGRQKQPQHADEVQRTQKQPPSEGDGDDDDATWMKQLEEDLMEKPEPANGNAAPYDTGMIEHVNEAGEEDASAQVRGRQKQPQDADEVQRTQKQPQDADEVQITQKQPPGEGDDDDDATWMKELVEDLKEKPEPASKSAAPYDAGMIKYINVGGYVMEQDAYDFIRFDLGMFPPSLEPESPVYDEPLQLWSSDDFSFPQGAPPPPPNYAAYVLIAEWSM
jgi:DNA-directed RNA polymerase subunit F